MQNRKIWLHISELDLGFIQKLPSQAESVILKFVCFKIANSLRSSNANKQCQQRLLSEEIIISQYQKTFGFAEKRIIINNFIL